MQPSQSPNFQTMTPAQYRRYLDKGRKPARKSPRHEEAALQRSCVEWLNLVKPRCYFFHPANGERRDARTGAILKKMGVRAGTPDFVFCVPVTFASGESTRTLFGKFRAIELKTDKGKLSPAQLDTKAEIEACGGEFQIARSLAEFQQIVKSWGLVGE